MTQENIKIIIGLGNPGNSYKKTRHNIGFQVLDKFADKYSTIFKTKDNFEVANITLNGHSILLIKPQAFMNNSGQIVPYLKKQGIIPQEILVVHDELELDFGKLAFKFGGSSKGHNGLKSIIANIGPDFWRLRFGISRPTDKSQVPDYVLQNFDKAEELRLDNLIDQAIDLISEKLIK